MAAFDANKLPTYDESIPDCLAFRKYVVHIDTYGTHLNQEDNPDGVTHVMYSVANFQNLKGHAPNPAGDPGQYPNNIAGGALENHKRQNKVSDNQKRCAVMMSNTFLRRSCVQDQGTYRVEPQHRALDAGRTN